MQSESEFLTAIDVQRRYRVSRMWIDRRIKDSGFPHPYKFGGRTNSVRRWRLSDLIAWEDQQRQAS